VDKQTLLQQEEGLSTESKTTALLISKMAEGGKKIRGSYPQSSLVIHSYLAVIHKKQPGGEPPPGRDWLI